LTFDGDGNVQTDIGLLAIGFSLAQHGDGRIVVAGMADDDLAVARYGSAPVNNTPPTPNSIGTPTAVVRQNAATISGSFTDPDLGDTHQVAWDFGDGNTIALHPSTDAGALTPTHAYANSGTFLVTFTVSDGVNPAVTTSTSVTVTASGIVSGSLLVGGTGSADNITVKDNVNDVFKVRIGGVIVGQYAQNLLSKIVIVGGNGADDIAIEADVTLPSEIYGGDGDDVIKGGGGNDVIFGEAGNDKLKARDAHDILVGGSDSDTLAGGDGRDLLFGGAGADKIAGQDDSDIILSGTTSYDTASPSNLAALQAIHTEWRRTDLTTSQRINSIKVTGVGPGNAYKLLGGTTVFDDGARDTLTSGSGGDWFLANPGGTSVLDKITDLNSVDFLDSITFILAP
jgi:Ca2+-binding RTX toxin-like protein